MTISYTMNVFRFSVFSGASFVGKKYQECVCIAKDTFLFKKYYEIINIFNGTTY